MYAVLNDTDQFEKEPETDENKELIKRYKAGDPSLMNIIIEKNLGLVRAVLSKNRWLYGDNKNGVVDYDDFYQEGVLSLYAAIEGYEPDKAEFSTYAYKVIQQSLYRFYYDKGSLIRRPEYKFIEYGKLRKAETEYYRTYGHEAKLKDLSTFSGISTDAILELRRSFQPIHSLDGSANESEEPTSLANIIPDETDCLDDVERKMTRKALREDLDIFMDSLLEKEERQILKQHFGWYGGKPSDFKRISRVHNCSEGQARNRVRKSLLILSRNRSYLANEYIELLSTLTRTTSLYLYNGEFSRSVTANTVEAVMKPGQTMNLIHGSKGDFITILNVESSFFEFIKVKNRGTELESVVDSLTFRNIKDYRTEKGALVEVYT